MPKPRKEVVCDRCGEKAQVGVLLPVRERRKLANAVGWRCDNCSLGKTYCPVCAPIATQEAHRRYLGVFNEIRSRSRT